MKSMTGTHSLRARLLLWLLGPLLIVGFVALYDGYNEARSAADEVSDRVLGGSALAIAERVFVNDDETLEVDIPYIALQMLTSSEDDRVFYRIENADADFITGYRQLQLPKLKVGDENAIQFVNGTFRGSPIRIATYLGAVSTGTESLSFRVGVAETTNARAAIASDILLRSAFRQGGFLFVAALLVWFAVTRALRPLDRLGTAVARRSPNDVRPIELKVPNEVSGLVSTINDLVTRFASAINALQNFTTNTSHQFRTPLSLIKTYLEIASREEDPVTQKEAIANAHTAVNDAERLMAQMLMLARIDATPCRELESETCDLVKVCREVCETFVFQLSNTGRFDVDLSFSGHGPIMITAEPTLTQEIIRNLIDNAIKHGGENIEIDVHVKAGNERAILEVRDTGNGFHPDIHEKYSRKPMDRAAHGSKKTGLGLAIIREILTRFNGQINIQSEEGSNGAQIEVSFQLVDSDNGPS